METKYQRERKEREGRIYDEYYTLIADPNNTRMGVMEYMLDKHGIVSPSTIYAMLRRVEARRNG